MILPNDILIRETSSGQTVWVSQRLVCDECGVDDEYLKICRIRYKQSLPASWQKVTGQGDFFLGSVPGKSWRWGRKNGQYYYDIDTIPNRKPSCYRDKLPTKETLIAQVDANKLRGSRERQAELRRNIIEQVQRFVDNSDVSYYTEYTVGDKHVFDVLKANQLAEAVAWCKFLKNTITFGQYKQMGFATQADFSTPARTYCPPSVLRDCGSVLPDHSARK